MALLEAVEISKQFGRNWVLRDIDFRVEPGRVHALLGQNGAGKSTLIKILTGVERPTTGAVHVDGRPVQFSGPFDARRVGIAAVYQEFSLVPQLSIAENLFLGRLPRRRGLVSWGDVAAQARAALQTVDLSLDPRLPVSRLPVAQRQLVEIARALALNCRVLILDEPTAAISRQEVERLFQVIGRLREQGVGIVYISHRLDEIIRLADDVTVLRDGRAVFFGPITAVNRDDLVQHMVGRSVTVPHRRVRPGAEPVFRMTNGQALTPWGRPAFSGLTFELRRGRVLGLTGPVGSGTVEVGRAVAGILPLAGGAMELHGEPYRPRTPLDATRRGIAFVSEDRAREGLIHPASVRANIAAPVLADLARHGYVADGREAEVADPYIERLGITPRQPLMPAGQLSGGNQQKAVLAKWLCRQASVFVLSEPTRGMDVSAKDDVYALIDALCEQRAAVLLISSEVEEVVAMSDDIIVLRGGQVVADFHDHQVDEAVVLKAVLGGNDVGEAS